MPTFKRTAATAKQRAQLIEQAAGDTTARKPKINLTGDARLDAAIPNALAIMQRDEIAQRIIAFWTDVIALDVDPRKLKWSDKLKASELAAKYVGLLDNDEKKTVFNTVNIIDARGASEADLLARLHEIEKQRLVIDATTSEGGSADGERSDTRGV